MDALILSQNIPVYLLNHIMAYTGVLQKRVLSLSLMKRTKQEFTDTFPKFNKHMDYIKNTLFIKPSSTSISYIMNGLKKDMDTLILDRARENNSELSDLQLQWLVEDNHIWSEGGLLKWRDHNEPFKYPVFRCLHTSGTSDLRCKSSRKISDHFCKKHQVRWRCRTLTKRKKQCKGKCRKGEFACYRHVASDTFRLTPSYFAV